MFRVIGLPVLDDVFFDTLGLNQSQCVICDRFDGLRGIVRLLVRELFEPLHDLAGTQYGVDGNAFQFLNETPEFSSFTQDDFKAYQAGILRACGILRAFIVDFSRDQMRYSGEDLEVPFVEVFDVLRHIELLLENVRVDVSLVPRSFLRDSEKGLLTGDSFSVLGRVFALFESHDEDKALASVYFKSSNFTYAFMTGRVADRDGDKIPEPVSRILCDFFENEALFNQARKIHLLFFGFKGELQRLVSYCCVFNLCRDSENFDVFSGLVREMRHLLCLRTQRNELLEAVEGLFPDEDFSEKSVAELLSFASNRDRLNAIVSEMSYGEMVSFLHPVVADGKLTRDFYSDGSTALLKMHQLKLIVALFMRELGEVNTFDELREGMNRFEREVRRDIAALKAGMWDIAYSQNSGWFVLGGGILRLFDVLVRPIDAKDGEAPYSVDRRQRENSIIRLLFWGGMGARDFLGGTLGSVFGSLVVYPDTWGDLLNLGSAVLSLYAYFIFLNQVDFNVAAVMFISLLPHFIASSGQVLFDLNAFKCGLGYKLAEVFTQEVWPYEALGSDRERIATVLPRVQTAVKVGVLGGVTALTGGGFETFCSSLFMLSGGGLFVSKILDRLDFFLQSSGVETAEIRRAFLSTLLLFGFNYFMRGCVNEFFASLFDEAPPETSLDFINHLALEHNVTRDTVKSTCRQLYLILHPDKGGSEDLFRRVREDCEALV